MSIRILTDSTCNLPEASVAKHGISVIPLYINQGDRSYLDGVDLTREEFYRRLSTFRSAPSLSTISRNRLREWNGVNSPRRKAIMRFFKSVG